ncbi:methyltransferase-domain-containing protein [Mycotypha africana]|uniref:methyltransferase-domain-containing protein n=1 Tax=Mycotypha africana TaxID=64632 RepID=UPI0023015596|nr:methyltransferase-domain-containing protein [Mycotypha africana]KAI8988603.1 methyltransferase-domain-containing protein [Mycotypha africana]
MQPLFDTSGWSLPKNIVVKQQNEVKKSNNKPAVTKTATEGGEEKAKSANVSIEADQLQAQMASLKQTRLEVKNNKKRQLAEKEKNNKQKQSKKQKRDNTPQERQQKQKGEQGKKPKESKNEPLKQQGQQNPVEDKNKKKNKQKRQKLKELLDKSKQASSTEVKPSVPVKATSATAHKNASTPSTSDDGLTPLQRKMKEKLSGARFRWLNEQLYTNPGNESFSLFQEKPELFDEYHEGFRHQVESWPVNPVDVIVEQLKQLPKKNTVIADLGCGDAMIAQTLTKQHYKVLSFDLIAKNDFVTACDISNLPLKANAVDVAVFSLSLMGTNYLDFLKEAYRILKPGGELKIAEVVSRFTDLDAFIKLLESLGFQFMGQDDDNKMFIMLYFKKQQSSSGNGGMKKDKKKNMNAGNDDKLQWKAQNLLKPCLYKRR